MTLLNESTTANDSTGGGGRPARSWGAYALVVVALLAGGLWMASAMGLFYRGDTPELTTREQLDSALAAKELVVIDLYSPRCGPCRRLAPVIDDLRQAWAGQVRFYRIDVDARGDLAGPFDVEAVPLLVFYRDGREVDRTLGFQTREELNRTLSRLTGTSAPAGPQQ